jgi:hypothetical protein
MRPSRFLFGCALFLTAATAPAAAPATDDSLAKLRAAASSVPGWTEQKEEYRSFTPRELYDLIDGGAVEYEKQGLIRGIVVTLASDRKSLQIYFDDFGSPERVKAMVAAKKKSSSAPREVPRVKPSPAIYDEVIGGCVVYWAKDAHYVEMILTGYDSVEAAVRDAATIIGSIGTAVAGRS